MLYQKLKTTDFNTLYVLSKTAFNIALKTIFTAYSPSCIHWGGLLVLFDLQGGGGEGGGGNAL